MSFCYHLDDSLNIAAEIIAEPKITYNFRKFHLFKPIFFTCKSMYIYNVQMLALKDRFSVVLLQN